eukprot:GHVL01016392.1.p1 GENE.GHVL01016392.1~~GHVL01016392.1.p1  ORF type:complete len:739 (+),score=67.28 GHVL01016392.1:140-2356(+)
MNFKNFDILEGIMSIILDNKLSKYLQTFGHRSAPVLQYFILILTCIVAFAVRLFAVIRFEAVIHEFDPYFNLRTTRFLTTHGFWEFWNWFDTKSWYPLGRAVGQTLFPGLMCTAAIVHRFLNSLGLIIEIKDVCVFIGPLFSTFTSIAAFLFTKEVTGRGEAGLFAAAFVGIVPSYLSRSVAGSYDNEAVSIFALLFAFYTYVRAINNTSLLSGLVAAIAFFYMALSWGAYVFVTNVVAIYTVAILMLGRFTARHYVVYTTFHVIGTILCLNIPFVNHAAIHSSEHLPAHGVFVVITVYIILRQLEAKNKALVAWLAVAVGAACAIIFIALTIAGKTRWSGRSMTLLDPSYAQKHIPIIASVSEHQPTIWAAYMLDLHLLVLLMPAGLFVCFRLLRDGHLFLALYGLLSVYFSAVMVRLMLVLAPAAACLSGTGLSYAVTVFSSILRGPKHLEPTGNRIQISDKTKTRSASICVSFIKNGGSSKAGISRCIALLVIIVLSVVTVQYVVHCTWTSSLAYSQPSIVIANRRQNGQRVLQDDFREAYYWLSQNTAPDAKIMAWWDYGYQLTGMSNRTVLVDNNTWNTTHIATVGLALSSTEEEAYPIVQKLDVDYVLVVFGGLASYSSDDINKFLWIIRITSGIYPHIRESDFYGKQGYYSVDKSASEKMLNSLMYKLNYYRFHEINGGMDYARQAEIGRKEFTLKHFEEAYTTTNWIVRIYSVKKKPNRGTKLKSRTFSK